MDVTENSLLAGMLDWGFTAMGGLVVLHRVKEAHVGSIPSISISAWSGGVDAMLAFRPLGARPLGAWLAWLWPKQAL